MPSADYNYTSVYGAEPYKDNGGLGGATVTAQNLIITAWEVESKGGEPPDPFLEFGDFLVPAYVNEALPAQRQTAAIQPMFSRHSAEVWLDSGITEAVCFVLNPPPELKQQLVRSVTFNGGDPLDLANYTVSKSLQGCYAWQGGCVTADISENDYQTAGLSDGVFSSYLPLGDRAGENDNTPLPFLKTNGADGVTPVFFDRFTADGVNEMIAAVNAGNFYIAYTVLLDAPPAHVFIKWPHSLARG